jgi:hypothetical protein
VKAFQLLFSAVFQYVGRQGRMPQVSMKAARRFSIYGDSSAEMKWQSVAWNHGSGTIPIMNKLVGVLLLPNAFGA